MKAEQVLAMKPDSEQSKAFLKLSPEEQRRFDAALFTPAELVAQDARTAVYEKYCDLCERYSEEFGRVFDETGLPTLVVVMLKLHVANQLRCEAAGIPPADLESSWRRSPWALFADGTLASVRAQLLKEVSADAH